MKKEYTSLGLMSGTSGDGVDASIIKSNGSSKYDVIKDNYYEYDGQIYQKIHYLKDKINNLKDLKNFSKELSDLEKKITLFHAKVIKEIDNNNEVDIVGFHGQTIYHNSQEKISVFFGIFFVSFCFIKVKQKKCLNPFLEIYFLKVGVRRDLFFLHFKALCSKVKNQRFFCRFYFENFFFGHLFLSIFTFLK